MVFALRTIESIEFKTFFIEVVDLCHEMFQEIISTLKRRNLSFNAAFPKHRHKNSMPHIMWVVLTVQSS